ncbi:MAG: GNAT family N-acetyltransferase [Hyphomicrobiaceae bacterium]|nr:GNAT family N-acetyltransferase [Hyphomicrobiaceae bacterium]
MSKPNALTIRIYHDIPALREVWREFQSITDGGPHDTWEWNAAWAQTAGASTTPLIAVGTLENNETVLLLPLAVRRRKGCLVLEWLSAEQGNYASGLFRRQTWADRRLPRGREFLKRLLEALPPVDAIHLTNQPTDGLEGWSPLSELPGIETASAGHAFPLNRDWLQHYNKRFGKRIRADIRRRERRLSEQGELGLHVVAPGADLEGAIDRMIEDKRQWFRDRGIEDFFTDHALRDFYLDLARMPNGEDSPRLKVFELSVGGTPIAANLGVIYNNVFYGLISSTTVGSLLRYGPGTILFLRLIEHLADRGIERIDCGAGEDDNKLRWCTIERPRFDTIVPVTLKGRIYAAGLSAKLAAKLRIKNSPRLWIMAKRLRRLGSGGRVHRQTRKHSGLGSGAVRIQT